MSAIDLLAIATSILQATRGVLGCWLGAFYCGLMPSRLAAILRIDRCIGIGQALATTFLWLFVGSSISEAHD
jgi:hypothetical protein